MTRERSKQSIKVTVPRPDLCQEKNGKLAFRVWTPRNSAFAEAMFLALNEQGAEPMCLSLCAGWVGNCSPVHPYPYVEPEKDDKASLPYPETWLPCFPSAQNCWHSQPPFSPILLSGSLVLFITPLFPVFYQMLPLSHWFLLASILLNLGILVLGSGPACRWCCQSPGGKSYKSNTRLLADSLIWSWLSAAMGLSKDLNPYLYSKEIQSTQHLF